MTSHNLTKIDYLLLPKEGQGSYVLKRWFPPTPTTTFHSLRTFNNPAGFHLIPADFMEQRKNTFCLKS